MKELHINKLLKTHEHTSQTKAVSYLNKKLFEKYGRVPCQIVFVIKGETRTFNILRAGEHWEIQEG